MHIYMHTYMHTYIMHAHTCTYMHIHAHTCTYMHIHAHTCMHALTPHTGVIHTIDDPIQLYSDKVWHCLSTSCAWLLAASDNSVP